MTYLRVQKIDISGMCDGEKEWYKGDCRIRQDLDHGGSQRGLNFILGEMVCLQRFWWKNGMVRLKEDQLCAALQRLNKRRTSRNGEINQAAFTEVQSKDEYGLDCPMAVEVNRRLVNVLEVKLRLERKWEVREKEESG